MHTVLLDPRKLIPCSDDLKVGNCWRCRSVVSSRVNDRMLSNMYSNGRTCTKKKRTTKHRTCYRHAHTWQLKNNWVSAFSSRQLETDGPKYCDCLFSEGRVRRRADAVEQQFVAWVVERGTHLRWPALLSDEWSTTSKWRRRERCSSTSPSICVALWSCACRSRDPVPTLSFESTILASDRGAVASLPRASVEQKSNDDRDRVRDSADATEVPRSFRFVRAVETRKVEPRGISRWREGREVTLISSNSRRFLWSPSFRSMTFSNNFRHNSFDSFSLSWLILNSGESGPWRRANHVIEWAHRVIDLPDWLEWIVEHHALVYEWCCSDSQSPDRSLRLLHRSRSTVSLPSVSRHSLAVRDVR